MRILIDVGHPAHVHLFKHFAWEMGNRGHSVFFTCRDKKEFVIYLLERYGFPYRSFGRKYVSTPGKIWGLIEFDAKEFLTGLKFRPDIFLSHGSMYAAHAAFLLRKPNIALEDTFNFEQLGLSLPFSDVLLTADYDNPLKFRKKNVSYAGYHELAYLHPNKFKPDRTVLKELGVSENEKYVIIRFVAWQATHDSGHKGMSLENKLRTSTRNPPISQPTTCTSSESQRPIRTPLRCPDEVGVCGYRHRMDKPHPPVPCPPGNANAHRPRPPC